METKIVPIFQLRILCLQTINPVYYTNNKDMIIRATLAAQDYIFSGKFNEYNRTMGKNFENLPGYRAVHKKYQLRYTYHNSTTSRSVGVNPGLVMDLAYSFHLDSYRSIINKRGEIINSKKLYLSEVLNVYNNDANSGIPMDALKKISEEQFAKILYATQKTK